MDHETGWSCRQLSNFALGWHGEGKSKVVSAIAFS